MKKIPLPLVMLLAPVAVLFGSLLTKRFLAPVDKDIATMVSGSIFASLAPVYKYLRDKEIRFRLFAPGKKDGSPRDTSWTEGFTLRWYLAILYGTVTVAGIIQIFSALAGFELGYLYSDQSSITLALGTFGIILGTLVFPAIYFMLGHWIGKRSDRFKAGALITTVILERALNLLLILVIPSAWFLQSFNMSRGDMLRDPNTWAVMIVFTLLGIIFGLIGVWRGHRVRMDGYLQEIFRVLPISLQEDIVSLAYDEAQRVLLSGSQESQLSQAST